MVDLLRLKVSTPKGVVFDEDVLSVTAVSELGEFMILPNHCDLLTSLQMGRFVVDSVAGGTSLWAFDKGFLEAGAKHVRVASLRCVKIADVDRQALTVDTEQLDEKIAALVPGDVKTHDKLQYERQWLALQTELCKS